MKPKPCKNCGSEYHTSLMCPAKERKPLKNKKAMHRIGKVGARWLEVRNEWMQNNPPDHRGWWECYICGRYLTIETLTLDHRKSRSRHPELRYELSNLSPCCYSCNAKKGSRDLIELA